MYLRLAFAVAAHLEPEILIVDEVLAVGDERFQKKCIKKMQDVRHHGRTVLFVSHNMRAVTSLCERVIMLEEGRVVQDGLPHEVIGAYLNHERGALAERVWPDQRNAPGGEIARLCSVRVKNEAGEVAPLFDIRKPIAIEMEYEVLTSGSILLPHLNIDNEEGLTVFTTIDNDPDWRGEPRPKGTYKSTAWIPGNFLSEGKLFVEACVLTTNPQTSQFTARNAVSFQVADSGGDGSARGNWMGKMTGVVRPLLKWQTVFSSNGRRAEALREKDALY
jgi:lipopolysaccharide transport system ATP-binding protein